jgi:hypothetical protein
VFLNLFELTAHFASKKFGGTPKPSKILQIKSKNSCLTLNKPKLAMQSVLTITLEFSTLAQKLVKVIGKNLAAH